MTLGHAQRELPTSKKKKFCMLLNHDIRYEPGYSLIMRKGPKVDAKAQLPGMPQINDLKGLNLALLKRHEQFSKSLTEKLMIYAFWP